MLPAAVPRARIGPRRRPHQRQPVLHQRRPAQQRRQPAPGSAVQKVPEFLCGLSREQTAVSAEQLVSSPATVLPLKRDCSLAQFSSSKVNPRSEIRQAL